MTSFEIPKVHHPQSGWPWTNETPLIFATSPDASPWPKISIVTPSFNQAHYLEETIRSVLLQGYPNLEYIIIDGGSSDGSVEIIKRYEPWLAFWVSEKDRGQSHAINKGFSHASGEVFAWINSDDYYAPGAFAKVARIFAQPGTQWVAGNCYRININGNIQPEPRKHVDDFERWFIGCPYAQPGVFWRRELWENAGGVDEKLHFSFDYDLWMKFSLKQKFASWTDEHLAYFRLQPHSKTVSNRLLFDKEDWIVFKRNCYRISPPYKRLLLYLQRREKSANRYMNKHDRSLPSWQKIAKAFSYAPWYLFKRKFYSDAKHLLYHH